MSYMDKDSSKRFHRKGFHGHTVNDYRYQREEGKPDPTLTNKRKHSIRQEARRNLWELLHKQPDEIHPGKSGVDGM